MIDNKRVPQALVISLLLLLPICLPGQKRGAGPIHARSNAASREEIRQASTRLSEMGYGAGPSALIAFQKYEGRKVTGRLTHEEVDAIMNAGAPKAREGGY